MKTRSFKKIIAAVCALIITAAFIAAVFLNYIFLPLYSRTPDRTFHDEADDITIKKKGRAITVSIGGDQVWSLEKKVKAQDFLYEDIDHDGRKDVIILCWKRGKYGKHRPSWVKHDELNWSQHIFIYRIDDKKVIPRWMASDTGVSVASWEYKDDMLFITDTDGVVTKWKWIHWGLEKM